MTKSWQSLQNGSDIRGVASNGVSGESINLSAEIVEKIATAFVSWLSERKGIPTNYLTIAVGRDSRISGPDLMQAFKHGVLRTGANAVDCGLSTTPAMFMSTIFDKTNYHGAVMLTASHLPFNRNGLKFFTCDGGLDKNDITAILELAESAGIVEVVSSGSESSFDIIQEYAGFLVNTIRKEVNHPTHFDTPLQGFHIIVDAGNGAGGFFAHQVLEPLGAITKGSQFLNPDGMFPNHVPNPEDDTAMQFIQRAVLQSNADLGIIFDTDVDRAAAVDHAGMSLNRNLLIALISAIILEEHPGTTIVTDSITSDGLSNFITKDLNGIHHRFKRGYKNVINEAIRLNNEGKESWLAIETSGHAALKENHFLDDGAFLMTKILIKLARLSLRGENFHDLIDKMIMPAESQEYRIKIMTPDFKQYGNKVINELVLLVPGISGWQIVPDNYEGIRVSCNDESGDGWFLLRLSLHDPVMALNVESNKLGGINMIMNPLKLFLKSFADLNVPFE